MKCAPKVFGCSSYDYATLACSKCATGFTLAYDTM